jgi:predicted transporter
VLGTSFAGGPGAAPLVSASNPNSFLAFTGMGLLRLVLLALVLIATGGYLVKRNSRNHRRHHRRPSAA